MGLENVKELWSVTVENSLKTKHYVLLLRNSAHICSCLTIIRQGIVCRHYFQVMLATSNAKFHIRLILSRWYKNDPNIMPTQPFLVADKFANDATEQNDHSPTSYLSQFGEKKDFMEQSLTVSEQKIMYGRLHGIYKKALQRALENKVKSQQLIELLEDFISTQDIETNEDEIEAHLEPNEENDLIVPHLQNPKESQRKGRPPGTKRLRSSHESVLKKSTNQRRCRGCGEVGHYQKNCKKGSDD